MPLYEYWCHHCQRKITLYSAAFSRTAPRCPQCDSNTLQRLFSTFSVRKTDQSVYEDILGDSQLTRGMLRNDPRALAEWNKRMSRGEKVTPEYEEVVERMEKGEMPTGLAGNDTQELPGETD